MPPKQVRCSVCDKTVNKCRTLMLDNGTRACREHEGVESQSAERREKENDDRFKQLDNWKHRLEEGPRQRGGFGMNFLDPNVHCWFCRIEGMRQDHWFRRVLIEQEKWAKIHGRHPNLFNQEEMMEVGAALKGKRCLWVISYNNDTKHTIDRNLHQQFDMVPRAVGFCLICPECSHKYELRPPEPDISPKALPLLAAIGERVRSEHEKVAVREMGRDN